MTIDLNELTAMHERAEREGWSLGPTKQVLDALPKLIALARRAQALKETPQAFTEGAFERGFQAGRSSMNADHGTTVDTLRARAEKAESDAQKAWDEWSGVCSINKLIVERGIASEAALGDAYKRIASARTAALREAEMACMNYCGGCKPVKDKAIDAADRIRLLAKPIEVP